MLTREQILEALRVAVEPLALAMWEGGSVARGAADAMSDIDLSIVVEDDAVAAMWGPIEAALSARSPIALAWHAPEPAWHGHAQRIYRLRDASPWLLVDVAIIKRSAADKFVDPEQHGVARVIFDRIGASAPRPFDANAFRDKLRAGLARAVTTFEMFESFVEKELARGRLIDAIHFWRGLAVTPLITVLSVKYRPLRFDFSPRYLDRDFPADVVRELIELHYVRDADDLRAKRPRARALFERTVAAIDLDAIDLDAIVSAARS
ncbi:MAG TPA: nucleotidyltransferase domain-containing protein [Kofleriaceae bacterium]|nr:nucleotidyltransferase domain-containing protein [Kofleriaceae bacterium]